MQIPLNVSLNANDMELMWQLYGIALGSFFIFAMLTIYVLTKIQGHLKVIRALMVAGLQTDSPEARRIAATIHDSTDES